MGADGRVRSQTTSVGSFVYAYAYYYVSKDVEDLNEGQLIQNQNLYHCLGYPIKVYVS